MIRDTGQKRLVWENMVRARYTTVCIRRRVGFVGVMYDPIWSLIEQFVVVLSVCRRTRICGAAKVDHIPPIVFSHLRDSAFPDPDVEIAWHLEIFGRLNDDVVNQRAWDVHFPIPVTVIE